MSGGTKYDGGKPRVSLIPAEATLEIAKVLTFGARKYDDHNWRKGILYSRLLDAAQRHLLTFQSGVSLDTESGLHHLAHAACCLAFLLEYESLPTVYGEFDDRYLGLWKGD